MGYLLLLGCDSNKGEDGSYRYSVQGSYLSIRVFYVLGAMSYHTVLCLWGSCN